jgi:hypothetical protein
VNKLKEQFYNFFTTQLLHLLFYITLGKNFSVQRNLNLIQFYLLNFWKIMFRFFLTFLF